MFIQVGARIIRAGLKEAKKLLQLKGAKEVKLKDLTPKQKNNIQDASPNVAVKKVGEGKRSMHPRTMAKKVKEDVPKGTTKFGPDYPSTKLPQDLKKTKVGSTDTARRMEKGLKREGGRKKGGPYAKPGEQATPKNNLTNAEIQAKIKNLRKTRTGKKTGGQVVKKYKKGKQIASADWMQGLTPEQLKQILGSPPTDKEGVTRHTKRKKNKPHKKKVSIKTAKAGGQMSRVGLSPAEEARSGTMSEAKRKKYKHGGPIHHNTSRENKLEELGRVDAEKAYTRKGKRNLKDEKKRIVRGLKKGGQVTNGNDFVALNYDS